MLTKCLLISSIASSIQANEVPSKRNILNKLGGGKSHPFVRAGDCANAGAGVKSLKAGPANVPAVIYDEEPYTDNDFKVPNSLFYEGYED